MDCEDRRSDSFGSLGNIKYDLRQNIMITNQIPPLKFIFLCRVAKKYWYDAIKYSLSMHFMNLTMKKLEKKVLDRVLYLRMPLHLKEELQQMIRSVRNEMSDFFVHDFNILKLENIDDKNACLDNIVWTIQGTINKLRTVKRIIKRTNLCTKKKYELACNNCLEGKIRDLMKLLPGDFIKSYLDKNLFSLVLYWTFFVRREQIMFSKIIEGANPLDYLLTWTSQTGKGAAFQFFCKRLFSEGKGSHLEQYVNLAGNSNVVFYIFLLLKKSHQKISVDKWCHLLRKLHRISKWCNIISFEKFVIELIRSKDVIDAFQIVLFCKMENLLYYNQYLDLWQKFASHFKSDIVNELKEFCQVPIGFPASKKKKLLTLRLLLEMATDKQKIIIMQKYDVDNLGLQLLNEGLYTFNFFLHEFIKGENRNVCFNSFIISRSGFGSMHILSKLICRGKIELIPAFLNRFTGEIGNYKKEFLYSWDKNVLDYLFADCEKENLDLVEALNNYLVWAFEGNEEEIGRYKTLFFSVFNTRPHPLHYLKKKLFDNFRNLMFEREWGSLNKYWNFIESANKDGLTTTTKKIIFIKFIFSDFKRSDKLHLRLVESLTRFLDSCFKKDELEELKERLKVSSYLCTLICDLLPVDHLKVNDLLNWCFSFVQIEIDEYKTLFINKHLGSVLSKIVSREFDPKKIRSMLVWFNPSVQQANLIKETFPTKIEMDRNYIRDYVENRKKHPYFSTTVEKRVHIIFELLTLIAQGNKAKVF